MKILFFDLEDDTELIDDLYMFVENCVSEDEYFDIQRNIKSEGYTIFSPLISNVSLTAKSSFRKE